MKDISLHLMDIVQNSIAAGADNITIIIKVTRSNNERYSVSKKQKLSEKLICEIIDNGRGMDSKLAQKVTDPFKTTRTTREVGLGIPLFRQSAKLAGGELILESKQNEGTKVQAFFDVNNIDRIPLGNISQTMKMLIMAYPQIAWSLEFTSPNDEFDLDTNEIKRQLGEVPLNNCDVLDWIERTVNMGIKKVFGGVLDEIR